MAEGGSKQNLGHTVVRPCTCANPYQDKRYGAGQRIHNVGKDKARCTVCSAAKGRS